MLVSHNKRAESSGAIPVQPDVAYCTIRLRLRLCDVAPELAVTTNA